jgi:addiction module HigA family antidote
MAELRVKRPIDRAPTHPGVLMREILDEQFNLATAEAAGRMKIAELVLDAVLRGATSATADIALRFGRLTGGAPELYVQMQAQYDLWVARQTLKDALADIEPAA